jgi:hypothetical protein
MLYGALMFNFITKGGISMDYKSVLEEQIRDLQKVQDSIVKQPDGKEIAACNVAGTIRELVAAAQGFKEEELEESSPTISMEQYKELISQQVALES